MSMANGRARVVFSGALEMWWARKCAERTTRQKEAVKDRAREWEGGNAAMYVQRVQGSVGRHVAPARRRTPPVCG